MCFSSPQSRFFVLVMLATVMPSWSLAQAQPGRGMGSDPIERHLFPPELVMAHQREIGLDGDQRQQLIEEMQALQSDMVPLQVEMTEAGEALADQLAEASVDEPAALALAERITGLEARIKHRHLTLLIRIKNLLRAEQHDRLRALRKEPGDDMR